MTSAQEQDTEPTIGRLVADASRDISTLLRSEIALAKSELKISVRAGGMGAALLAVAGFLALLSLILLSITIAYFIHMAGLHQAWSFLIVFGCYLLLAVVLALVGIRKLKKVGPPAKAIEQAQKSKQILSRSDH
ncbi:MAG: phage holin family protein [Propionibacteriales bacterium]|nr:phage holin family protein [Propionibacteriales bacterium]